MHVFITGAATGIGEATIDAILEKIPSAGFTIADKNQQALQEVCQKLTRRGVHNHGIACDLTDIDGIPDIVNRSRQQMGEVELLVNNAGVMLVEDFTRMSWEKAMLTVNLNLLAPARLMKEVLPGMLERDSGGIINIASMAGKTLLPGCTWYGASKAGIGQISEITGLEIENSNVHILTVYPGPVDTGLAAGARANLEENLAARYMPVGDRETLARKMVHAFLNKQDVLAYPEIYDTARHFHTLSAWFAKRLAPRTR
ncbi:MAG: SDR family NAD(P)-dependent oxidoreductase [Spirochaetota bacterium]